MLAFCYKLRGKSDFKKEIDMDSYIDDITCHKNTINLTNLAKLNFSELYDCRHLTIFYFSYFLLSSSVVFYFGKLASLANSIQI